MEATKRPRVKICCISSVQEAWLAIHYGASALGLVSEMPSGPGVIAEDTIAAIVDSIPPPIASFLLTSKQDAEAIIAQQQRCRVNVLQLVDHLPTESLQRLREALPGISLIQVIHVNGPQAIEEALTIAPYVHAILLDSGNPSLSIKELGGTGRVHDWDISRQIREAVHIPIFLAGGIHPDNVRAAIEHVGPFGIDLCSGVRTNGQLDEAKLAQFFSQIQQDDC